MKEKKRLIRLVLTFVVTCIGFYILNRYEYIKQFKDIDHILGMLPVALVFVAVLSTTILIWIKHSKQYRIISIILLLTTILSSSLFPFALRKNWWIKTITSHDAQTSPDLTVYAPFTKDSKVAILDEVATLHLDENLPIMDGATALYPVYAAFANAVYHEDVFADDDVVCTNTGNAYQAIIAGERDVIFVAGASKLQQEKAKELGMDLKFTPIGREAFVFLVGKENPIDSITYQQIRNIYSGKTAHWKTLGWKEGGSMIAFSRPEGSGSQTGLQNIMGNLPIQVPQPLPDPSLIGTNSLMKQLSVTWQGVQPAIGYSYRYYATTMYANPDVKLLQINGIEPSIINIQNGTYPFVANFYAVTNGEAEGNTKALIDWILSKQGQELIAKTGYTPIK